MTKVRIFFILGQTATGKTARAAELAKEVNGELVNCDSRQVYRYLNIITGKTDNPIDIPMHMVDLVNPSEVFSAYEYAVRGIEAIEDIVSRGKVPIVVGGTGNYARMLLYMNPKITPDPSSSLRGIINACPPLVGSNLIGKGDHRSSSSLWITHTSFEGYSKQDLQQTLKRLDERIYEHLTQSDKENPRRLIAAIQRIENAYGKILDSDSPHALANRYHTEISVLLHKKQEDLHSRITRRVDDRLSSGAVEECASLVKRGYKSTDPGLATIGYQSIFRYLAGDIDREKMRTEWATKERQYAKRQKTYLLKYFPHGKIVYV